jgi:hypothetical protein
MVRPNKHGSPLLGLIYIHNKAEADISEFVGPRYNIGRPLRRAKLGIQFWESKPILEIYPPRKVGSCTWHASIHISSVVPT